MDDPSIDFSEDFLVRYIIVYSFSERRKGSGQFSQHLYFQRPSELSRYKDKL